MGFTGFREGFDAGAFMAGFDDIYTLISRHESYCMGRRFRERLDHGEL